jgi:hypothetical protein
MDHDTGSADHSHSGDDQHHAPTANLTASVVRMAAATAKTLGYERTAKLITNWPELAGTKIGQLILKMRHQQDAGQAVTPEQETAIETTMREEPAAAAQILAIVVGGASGQILSADAEREQILSSYRFVLDTITDAMARAKTSFALKGFLHDPECISYWHLDGLAPKFSRTGNYLYTSSFEVYFLQVSPTAENLQVLNEEIRRNPKRRLSADLFDFRRNGGISLLKKVEELAVTLERQATTGGTPNPFHQGTGLSTEEISFDIPFGAPSMVTMFESLFEAQRIQSSPITSLEATGQQVKTILDKVKDQA